VKLEIEQTQISPAIEIESQLFEIAQKRPLFFEQGLGEPARAIAANVLTPLPSMFGADAGGGEVAPIAAAFGASDQLADTLFGNEAIVDGNAAVQEGGTSSPLHVNAHRVLRAAWSVPVLVRSSWSF
jgi:hypothetical protein